MTREDATKIVEDAFLKSGEKTYKEICIDTVIIYEGRLHHAEVDYVNLANELVRLRDTVLDFMMDLDRNKVEIPVSMYDDWNNLESILDD